jgi:hypothetical protein
LCSGNDEKTCTSGVETMDNAGTVRLANRRYLRKLRKQAVHKSARIISGTRVHNEPGLFVNNNDVIIVVEYEYFNG